MPRTLTLLRSKAFRRTQVVAAGGVAVMAFLAFMPAPGAGAAAAAPVAAGTGLALGQTWKIDPKAAGLSIGIAFGQATSTHTNNSAKAVSQSINLGALGTSLGAQQCDGSDPSVPYKDQPHPTIADSHDADAANGISNDERGFPGLHMFAKANTTPFSEAITKTGPFNAGAFEMGNGVARTTSGLVNGVRVATSTVDIDYLALGGLGASVFLSQLHWEASWTSNQTNPVGKFTLGGGSINGTPVNGQDPSATLDAANKVLDTIGMHIIPGGHRVVSGVLFVDPLSIQVVPNATRDKLIDSVYRPLYNGFGSGEQNVGIARLFEEMYNGSCKSANLITVYDIVVGSMTGGGSFSLQFGGVQASSGEVPQSVFNLQNTQFETTGGDEEFTIPGTPDEETPAVYTPGRSLPDTPVAAPATTVAPAKKTSKKPLDIPTSNVQGSLAGTRGGAMLGVGIATLALLAAAIEGDRRKMRHAQLMIPATAVANAPEE